MSLSQWNRVTGTPPAGKEPIQTIKGKGGCWPSREQELLLRASLLQGKDALEAWQEWQQKVDIDRLDQGSFRLLPLLYRNLCTHAVTHSLMGKLKGVYRSVWYQNQTLLHSMADLLATLCGAGIQTMVLKGAALTLLHYGDHGLRPMSDFDVLVPTGQAPEATDLLVGRGWTPLLRPLARFSEEYLSMRPSNEFRDAGGRSFDFHWHVLLECCYPGADDDFWDCAVPVEFHGVPTTAPSPADLLLHVCVHGSRWNSVPPFRWVADGVVVQAGRRRLLLPMANALRYLRDLLDAPVPIDVLRAMENAPLSRTERAEYRASTHPPGLLGDLRRNWFLYLRWRRGDSNRALQPGYAGFGRYLQHVWGLDHRWQVPLRAIYRGTVRARQRLASHVSVTA
jgi:hypothetical protein